MFLSTVSSQGHLCLKNTEKDFCSFFFPRLVTWSRKTQKTQLWRRRNVWEKVQKEGKSFVCVGDETKQGVAPRRREASSWGKAKNRWRFVFFLLLFLPCKVIQQLGQKFSSIQLGAWEAFFLALKAKEVGKRPQGGLLLAASANTCGEVFGVTHASWSSSTTLSLVQINSAAKRGKRKESGKKEEEEKGQLLPRGGDFWSSSKWKILKKKKPSSLPLPLFFSFRERGKNGFFSFLQWSFFLWQMERERERKKKEEIGITALL